MLFSTDRPSFDEIVTRLDQYHFRLKRQHKPSQSSQPQPAAAQDPHTLGTSASGENFEVGLKHTITMGASKVKK